MLTWADICKTPAFHSLEQVSQALYVLGQYVPQPGTKAVLDSAYLNQNLRAVTHFRDQLVANPVTAEVLALYAMTGDKADIEADVSQALAVANKHIADLDSRLAALGLKQRELTEQEAADLKTVLSTRSR